MNVDLEAMQTAVLELNGLPKPNDARSYARVYDQRRILHDMMRPAVEAHPFWQQILALGYTPLEAPYLRPALTSRFTGTRMATCWSIEGSCPFSRDGLQIWVGTDRLRFTPTLAEALTFPLRVSSWVDGGYVAQGKGREARKRARATQVARQLQEDQLLDFVKWIGIRVTAQARLRTIDRVSQFVPQDLLVEEGQEASIPGDGRGDPPSP